MIDYLCEYSNIYGRGESLEEAFLDLLNNAMVSVHPDECEFFELDRIRVEAEVHYTIRKK